jgi:hypothetical protein
MVKLLSSVVLVVSAVLGFFAGMSSLALYTALRSVGADIFSFIVLTVVPYALFALILFADGKDRRDNSTFFLIALFSGALFLFVAGLH